MENNVKALNDLLKMDRIKINEIRHRIGTGRAKEIFELHNSLDYIKVEEKLDEIRFKISPDEAGLFLRTEKEIKILRDDDYEICQFINENQLYRDFIFKKSEEKEPEKIEIIKEIDMSKITHIFSNVKNEILPIVLSNEIVIDLVKMPHLLVAGETGSGKSVFLNVAILSLLRKSKCKLVLIDPKRVEFSQYRGLRQLLYPVAVKIEKIEEVLNALVAEMEKRYEILDSLGKKNVSETNLERIVVVIDELADLMLVSEHKLDVQIIRLAQLARAIGIHLIMATQRPIAEIMTGLIKANMPARISFRVASKQDSRIILDENGAELLKEPGDMIFKFKGEIINCKGVYVEDKDIKKKYINIGNKPK